MQDMNKKTVTTSPQATVIASFDESGEMFISKVCEPPKTWSGAACGYIAFLRSVIRRGEQLTLEDDAMVDKFLDQCPVQFGLVEWKSGEVRPPYEPPPHRRATKDEVMMGAATSDYIEFLIYLDGQVRAAAWSPSYGWPFDTPDFWAELPEPPNRKDK